MTTLVIPAALRAAVAAHLAAAYPEEGCGVMLGRERGARREVERVLPIDNRHAEARGRRYLIAPEQFLAAEREARAAGLEVLGFFHSHPDHPAQPSAFDVEHAWPYYSYVIVRVTAHGAAEARSWRLGEDRAAFETEALEEAPAAPAPARGESAP